MIYTYPQFKISPSDLYKHSQVLGSAPDLIPISFKMFINRTAVQLTGEDWHSNTICQQNQLDQDEMLQKTHHHKFVNLMKLPKA